MSKKSKDEIKRRSNLKEDIRLYLRLLKNLSHLKKYIVLALLCMTLEAWFQLFSIAMMKPVLDLIFMGTFLDISKYVQLYGSDSKVQMFDNGKVIAVKINGEMSDKNSQPFVDKTTNQMSPSVKNIYIDISETTKVNKKGWSELLEVELEAMSKNIPIKLILPHIIDKTKGLSKFEPDKLFPIASPEETQLLRAKYFDSMILRDPSIKKKDFNFVDSFKFYLVKKFTPVIEYLQEYSTRSFKNKFTILVVVMVVVLISTIFKCIFSFLNGYLTSFLGNTVVRKMRENLYRKIVNLDVKFFSKHSVGHLMSNVMQDVSVTETAVTVIFERIFKGPILIINTFIFMIVISPSLTFFSLIAFPAAMYPLWKLGVQVRKLSKGMQQQKSNLNVILSETFNGIRIVKAYNMESHEIGKFKNENKRLFKFTIRGEVAAEFATQITEIIGVISIGLMVLIGGYYILEKEFLDAPSFVLFLGAMATLFKPLKGMSKTNAKIQKGLAGAERVFAVMDVKSDVREAPDAVNISAFNKEIIFDHVNFSYDENREVLTDITFNVPKGKIIAFVGETGAGKTTLVNLLPRFYDISSGSITIDGIDIRKITFQSLRQLIAIVTQDVVLFDDTIRNNICYGHSDEISIDKVIEASKAANAHNYIMELENGYDTQVGEHGVRLSGGQRQRIAIARAILKNSPILILDEATSSLDSKTEREIQEAINFLITNRTTFVIAHRLSTILHADEICVLDKGQIVERGRHDELLKLDGIYAHLYNIQFNPENQPAPLIANNAEEIEKNV